MDVTRRSLNFGVSIQYTLLLVNQAMVPESGWAIGSKKYIIFNKLYFDSIKQLNWHYLTLKTKQNKTQFQ